MQNKDNFESLSLMEKRVLLFGKGKLIITREQDEHKISLFDLNGEYFEVVQATNGNQLLKIEQLNDYEKLQTYYNTSIPIKSAE